MIFVFFFFKLSLRTRCHLECIKKRLRFIGYLKQFVDMMYKKCDVYFVVWNILLINYCLITIRCLGKYYHLPS